MTIDHRRSTPPHAILTADVGGTWTRAARFPWPWPHEAPPKPLALRKRPTRQEDPTQGLLDLLREVWPEGGRPQAIAVAAPGPLDPETGVVYTAPNLPAWKQEPLKDRLEQALGVPVWVGNDANLAALGEYRFGAGRGTRHMLFLTLSTGVGGGVICHGRLLLGRQGLAAELGHITLWPEGPRCSCGGRGHLEALASGPALVRRAKEALAQHPESLLNGIAPLTGEAIAQAARQGDALAQEILAEAGRWVGLALADLCHIFNPERIVLGGGVAQSGPWLWQALEASLAAHLMNARYRPAVVPAALGDQAGLLGGLALLEAELPPPPATPVS